MSIISCFGNSQVSADMVTAGDANLQQFYNEGKLVGPPGLDGNKGPQGNPGPDGESGTLDGYYGICESSSNQKIKVVQLKDNQSIKDFTIGSKITIKFLYSNIVNEPYLSASGYMAPLMRYGTTPPGYGEWQAGDILDVVFDGTNWVIEGQHDDENGLQLDGDTIQLKSTKADITDQIKALISLGSIHLDTFKSGLATSTDEIKVLDFSFIPKFVIVAGPNFYPGSGTWNDGFIWMHGVSSAMVNGSNTSFTQTGNSLTFNMLFSSNTTYTYIGIG